MRYYATIWVVLLCFIGPGMSHTAIPCETCDTIPADTVKRVISEVSREVFREAMDSLKTRFKEVETKKEILILKTAMLEKKMSREYVGHVDSFRTLTGWHIVYWLYDYNGFTRIIEKNDNVRSRNSTNRPKVHRAD